MKRMMLNTPFLVLAIAFLFLLSSTGLVGAFVFFGSTHQMSIEISAPGVTCYGSDNFTVANEIDDGDPLAFPTLMLDGSLSSDNLTIGETGSGIWCKNTDLTENIRLGISVTVAPSEGIRLEVASAEGAFGTSWVAVSDDGINTVITDADGLDPGEWTHLNLRLIVTDPLLISSGTESLSIKIEGATNLADLD